MSASYVTAAANLNIARQTVSRHVARLLEDGKTQEKRESYIVLDNDRKEYTRNILIKTNKILVTQKRSRLL